MSIIPPGGPNNNVAGAFGAQQSQLAYQLGLQDPQKLADSTVVITPPDSFVNGQLTQKGVGDFLAYAKSDIDHYDKADPATGQKDGKLNLQEATDLFGGNAQLASTMMDAISQSGQTDATGSKAIGLSDMAAYVMAQDAPKQMYRNSAPGLDDGFFDTIQIGAQAKDPTIPEMQRDGQATMAERTAMDTIITTAPNIAGIGMKTLQDKLNLREKAQDFIQRQNPPSPPGGNWPVYIPPMAAQAPILPVSPFWPGPGMPMPISAY